MRAARCRSRSKAAAAAKVHAEANGGRGFQAVSSKDGFNAVIRHGRIGQYGPPQLLYDHPVDPDMAGFLAPKVPRYKMPKRFFFWDALPKSGYGKVPKRLVRDELEARGLLDLTTKQPG